MNLGGALPYGIRDVAEQAGVSKTTVSRVMNHPRLVDPETRKRVMETAKKLNYYRNANARRLASGGKSDFFGLIISDIENPVFPEMIKSFETAAAKKSYDLLLCTTNYDEDRTHAAVRMMIENTVRGVAIMTSSASLEVAEELAARQLSVVLVDLGLAKRNISSIDIDYSGGVCQALDHLIELRHEKLVFVTGPEDRRSSRRYRETVLQAMNERTVSLSQIVECDQTLEGGRAAIKSVLAKKTLPTAVLCINDLTAIGVMAALREMHIKVPEQVSVIGCEDIYMARFVNPPLTTIRVDRKKLGTMAFEVLEKMSRSKRHGGADSILGTDLVVRGSTGPAAHG